MTTKLIAIFLIAPFLITLGCKKEVSIELIQGETMGTTYSIKFLRNTLTPPKTELESKVNQILVDVNQKMSTYIKDSELSKFNASSTTQEVKVSSEFFNVLTHALDVAKKTNGAFDPTLGPLVNLWGFGPGGERRVPSKELLKKTKEHIGFEKIGLNKAQRKISKSDPRVYIDLSASAKGFGVDQVAQYLQGVQLTDYMVEIGGEIRTRGQNNGSDWRIGIESPDTSKGGEPILRIIKLKGMAMATSGDYRNFFESGGRKYSHTIDYRSGDPVQNDLASVTVIDKSSCMNADAWATAFMALGVTKSLELSKAHSIAALFVLRDKSGESKVVESPSFKKVIGE